MKSDIASTPYAANVRSKWSQFAKWSGLTIVVFPPLFVLFFSVAGFLRPGYSPIHQTISDLGVGPLAWLVDIPVVILGLLMIALAVGIFQTTHSVMSPSWRWICATLVALPGLGLVAAGIFTEAPSTLLVHWLVGATLGLYFPVVTFLFVGLRLMRDREWRGYGIYSLVACLATVALIAFLNMAFTPGSPLAGLRLGGLAERMDLIEILAWYVIFGWRLFRLRVGS